MKQVFMMVLVLALAAIAVAQNPVAEAKAKIEKQKHEQRVDQAKRLLEQKADLEKQLAIVNDKLAKLENGEEVKEEGAGIAMYGGSGWVATGYCCPTTTGLCGSCGR